MDAFLNAVKRHAAQLDQSAAQPRFGIVSSVDTTAFLVRVLVQPENVLSGWLPVSSPWIGNGWGLAAPPSPGDQVLLLWQEGDSEHGVVVGRCWSSQVAAPSGTSAGEFWLVHKSGSRICLRNDGSIQSAAGTWTHTGDLHVTGNVYDHHGSLDTLRNHYNEHTHPPSNAPAVPAD